MCCKDVKFSVWVLKMKLISYRACIYTDEEAMLLRTGALHLHDVPCLAIMKPHDARGGASVQHSLHSQFNNG
jgi:hypothetical protein